MREKSLFYLFVVACVFVFLYCKCRGNKFEREVRESRYQVEQYQKRAESVGCRLEELEGRAERIRTRIGESERELEYIRGQIQGEIAREGKGKMDNCNPLFDSGCGNNLYDLQNYKVRRKENMNFVIFLISWFRTYLMGINEYAGSILIMSVIFYILVWGLKKALPEFWAIKLYDKTSVKVVKKEDGTSEIVRVKSEKRMNTLIPLFVSFAGFIVFLFLTKINTQTSAIAGGACALLASTIDNMLSIVANTLSTVFELVKRLFGKMSSKKKEVNKNEERIENLEGKIDALVNALAPKTSAYNSKDTQQG